MRQAGSSNVALAPAFDRLPFHAAQASSRATAILLLMLLIPALGLVLVPVAMVLVFATGELRDAVTHHPLVGAILASGLAGWLTLLLVAAKRIILRFGKRRNVTIACERVTVAEENLFGSRLWSLPLAEFRGVAHHVRATLSGVRHELILVHPMPDRSVLLHSANAIAQATIEDATRLLRLQQIPAQELYRITQRRSAAAIADALPEAQAA